MLHDPRIGGCQHGSVKHGSDPAQFQGLGHTNTVVAMVRILDPGLTVPPMHPHRLRQMRATMLTPMGVGMEQGRHALQQDEQKEEGAAEQHQWRDWRGDLGRRDWTRSRLILA